ncbi:MAG TPA: VOC family protein [Polyangia bacterium]|nr:VOC family protein [Polyangia bacterium]
MLDHVSLRVQDLDRALAFYKPALAAIGYRVLMEFPGTVGMGADGKPDLWISQTDQPVSPIHIALSSTRPSVDAFHSAATAAGGSDNGPPGLRADYHPHYYAAFVRDPDGNNIEVVCHADPAAVKLKAKAVVKAKPKAKAAPKKAVAAKSRKPAKPAKAAKKKSGKSAKKRAKKRR